MRIGNYDYNEPLLVFLLAYIFMILLCWRMYGFEGLIASVIAGFLFYGLPFLLLRKIVPWREKIELR
jgi:hypothetical protein